jgi:3-oxoadipate enol-lactonase
MRLEKSTITVAPNVTLALWERPGTLSPILFLHGVLLDSRLFAPVMDGFDDHRLLALDLRGCGASTSQDARALPFGDHLRDVLTIMHEHVDGPCHLVGHSLGGIIALAVAIQDPTSVRSLSLLGTHADSENPNAVAAYGQLCDAISDHGTADTFEPLQQALLHPAHHAGASHTAGARFAQILAEQNSRTSAACFRGGLARPSFMSHLALVQAPTVSLIGENDLAVPPSAQRLTAAAITGCAIESIATCGHLAPLEQPDIVCRTLMRHVRRE